MSLGASNIRFGHSGGPQFGPLSFTLAPGTLNTLTGPNGSGKSTLLRALSGILPLRGGEAHYAGQDLARLGRRALSRLLAYVPQQPPAAPLTVYDAVMLGRTPHMRFAPAARDKAAVAHTLEALNIAAWRERPLPELSGGERQKVFIGLALAQETPVILLDEPAHSLDLRQQMEVYELLQGLCREQGKLVLVAEHDLNLAARYSDEVLVMHAGGIAAQGAPEAVFTTELLQKIYAVNARVVPLDPMAPISQGAPSQGGRNNLNIVCLGFDENGAAAHGKNGEEA